MEEATLGGRTHSNAVITNLTILVLYTDSMHTQRSGYTWNMKPLSKINKTYGKSDMMGYNLLY